MVEGGVLCCGRHRTTTVQSLTTDVIGRRQWREEKYKTTMWRVQERIESPWICFSSVLPWALGWLFVSLSKEPHTRILYPKKRRRSKRPNLINSLDNQQLGSNVHGIQERARCKRVVCILLQVVVAQSNGWGATSGGLQHNYTKVQWHITLFWEKLFWPKLPHIFVTRTHTHTHTHTHTDISQAICSLTQGHLERGGRGVAKSVLTALQVPLYLCMCVYIKYI